MHVKVVTLCCRVRLRCVITLACLNTTTEGWLNETTHSGRVDPEFDDLAGVCAERRRARPHPSHLPRQLCKHRPPAAATAEPDAPPERIVIEGKRPGPGVWKVSKDGHVMWVFGLYSPLPQKMEWDSSRVERLIAGSQEVLLPPGVSVNVGLLGSLSMLPSMIGIQKNPDGATLKDVLPADVYARWTVLKDKYIGNDNDVERYRPIFASEKLMEAALEKSGLSAGRDVRKQIDDIARKNKVKTVSPAVQIELEHPRDTVKDFKASKLEDVACMTKTLDSLESDLDAKIARANAWANGNIAAIKSLNYAERDQACSAAVLNSSVTKGSPELRDSRERMRGRWLLVAQRMLADNTQTFAVLQIKDIVDPKGLLAELQNRGYTVESPK